MKMIESEKPFVIAVVFVLVIFFGLVGLYIYNSKTLQVSDLPTGSTTDSTSSAVKGEARESTINGTMGLSHKGSKTSYKKGDQVTLFVYADSGGQQMKGYDAILKYDASGIGFESVRSIVEGMDVFHTPEEIGPNEQKLWLTGTPEAGANDTVFVFNNTALAEVTFTVLGNGPIEVELVYEPGSEKESNLQTTANRDILSSVSGTTIEVK